MNLSSFWQPRVSWLFSLFFLVGFYMGSSAIAHIVKIILTAQFLSDAIEITINYDVLEGNRPKECDLRGEKKKVPHLVFYSHGVHFRTPDFCNFFALSEDASQKQTFREETDGSFAMAKTLVPQALNKISVTTVRRYFQHCYRYMDAYKHGLNIRQAEYAVKK
ncbi:hypothetical protein BDP27DRAFT_1410907 [Rhodocollybia butyracea]|uniref:Uncharacterized protein n=1 Tax=Rhodocollybia butyracea TaxID=206335 RepID=A0A9P5P5Y7_9AGAR|nr:hypothetical protein BDP27DRAFT_1410907 [Rhodocollybia butyracea]